jgi:hypothetical protein
MGKNKGSSEYLMLFFGFSLQIGLQHNVTTVRTEFMYTEDKLAYLPGNCYFGESKILEEPPVSIFQLFLLHFTE